MAVINRVCEFLDLCLSLELYLICRYQAPGCRWKSQSGKECLCFLIAGQSSSFGSRFKGSGFRITGI